MEAMEASNWRFCGPSDARVPRLQGNAAAAHASIRRGRRMLEAGRPGEAAAAALHSKDACLTACAALHWPPEPAALRAQQLLPAAGVDPHTPLMRA
jgi:hypothetical protein